MFSSFELYAKINDHVLFRKPTTKKNLQNSDEDPRTIHLDIEIRYGGYFLLEIGMLRVLTLNVKTPKIIFFHEFKKNSCTWGF